MQACSVTQPMLLTFSKTVFHATQLNQPTLFQHVLIISETWCQLSLDGNEQLRNQKGRTKDSF